jgi:hypothetical protein
VSRKHKQLDRKHKHVVVRRIKKEDVDFVIRNIREADKRELEDVSGLNYKDTLKEIYLISENAWTGLVDDEVVAIFGVQMVSYLTGRGVPWLISTKGVEKYSITFLRHSKPVLKKITGHCRQLVNFVDDRNKLAKLWLQWLGFVLDDPIPYGAKSLPFRPFKMEIKNV